MMHLNHRSSRILGVALLACTFTVAGGQESPPRWPAPDLTDQSYREWLAFIRPEKSELAWQQVRWQVSLAAAAKEAKQLQRPILLWAMNGHPCGET